MNSKDTKIEIPTFLFSNMYSIQRCNQVKKKLFAGQLIIILYGSQLTSTLAF